MYWESALLLHVPFSIYQMKDNFSNLHHMSYIYFQSINQIQSGDLVYRW